MHDLTFERRLIIVDVSGIKKLLTVSDTHRVTSQNVGAQSPRNISEHRTAIKIIISCIFPEFPGKTLIVAAVLLSITQVDTKNCQKKLYLPDLFDNIPTAYSLSQHIKHNSLKLPTTNTNGLGSVPNM